MSDQSNNTTDALRPREADALAAWDSLDGGDKTYKNVADILSITEGRAGVYVRDALNKTGRGAETPRAQGSTGGRRKATSVVNPFRQQLESLLEQNRTTVESLSEQINEAKANSADFDPDKAISEHTEALTERLKAAQAALDAFEGDVAQQWATERAEQLSKQADSIEETVSEQLVQAQANVQMAEATLAMMPAPAEGPEGDEDVDEDDETGPKHEGPVLEEEETPQA